MEEALNHLFAYLIVFVEACGAFVICVGVTRSIIAYIRCFVFNHKCVDMAALRVELGKSMILALEFQVAADILKTGVSPTWKDILLLAAIIVLRTLLNYLLEHEMESLEPIMHANGETVKPA